MVMINLALSIIVFHYLVRTRDLFKILKVVKNIVLDLFVALKKEKKTIENSPLDIVKLRYVKGEISQSEYEKIISSL